MRRWGVALGFAALGLGWGAPSGEATLISHPCAGRWEGWGRQEGDSPWSIEMVVTRGEGERCGTIEYPSLGCGGYLARCRLLEDGWVEWEEVYTHNPGTCAPAGRIVGRCTPAGQMRWIWTGISRVETRLRRAASEEEER